MELGIYFKEYRSINEFTVSGKKYDIMELMISDEKRYYITTDFFPDQNDVPMSILDALAEKYNLINGSEDNNKESDNSNDNKILDIEEVAWMDADEYNEGYHYNKLTGKKVIL